MSAPGVIPLAARKQALLAEAALHRQIIVIERLQMDLRVESIRQRFQSQRWWLMGGALLAGVVLRKAGGLASWLPMGLTALRALQALGKK
jgi:hypothetical protein